MTASLTLTSLYSFSGQVNATCDSSALSGAQCALSVANPITVTSGVSVPITATVTVPPTAASGNYNINITLQNTAGVPSHTLTVPITVGQSIQDFGFGAFTPATQTISSGLSASYSFSVIPSGGSFANAVSLSCSGLSALTQCSFSPTP